MKKKPISKTNRLQDYEGILSGVVELLDAARRTSARAVNSVMTATYWEVGRRIVEFEQGGEKRAEYGEELLIRLGEDLVSRFGRGFSRRNLQSMRQFYLYFPASQIWQTLSAKSPAMKKRATVLLESGEDSIEQTVSAKSSPLALADLARASPAMVSLRRVDRPFPLARGFRLL